MSLAARAVGSILKHDKKVNSYKLALIRSINDVVLSYPDLADGGEVPAVWVIRYARGSASGGYPARFVKCGRAYQARRMPHTLR